MRLSIISKGDSRLACRSATAEERPPRRKRIAASSGSSSNRPACSGFWYSVVSMMTMLRLTTVVALIASASASPALVWNSAQPEQQETVYTSASAEPEELLSNSGTGTTSVVFLLARGEKGMEGLTPLAPQLSRVAKLPPSHVYSHVAGVQSGAYLQKQAKQHESSSLVVSLDEWSTKLNNTLTSSTEETVVVDAASGISTPSLPSKTQIKQTKRAQQLEQANLLIVNVEANVTPERLDAAVAAAVQHSHIERVVLTAVRGVDEVKHERVLLEQRRLQKMHQAGRQSNNRHRRLEQEEEAQGDDANNNNNYNSDMEGVYYVSLTPNILAGILFFFMFATVTWTGISCMGMIQGQEIYVHKMPTIGRES